MCWRGDIRVKRKSERGGRRVTRKPYENWGCFLSASPILAKKYPKVVIFRDNRNNDFESFFWQGSGLNKLLGYKNQQIYVIRYHSEYMQLNWLFVRLLSARWISSIKAVYCILKAKGLEFANEKKKCGQIEPLHIEINDKLTAAQKPTPTPLSHHIRPMTSPSGSL